MAQPPPAGRVGRTEGNLDTERPGLATEAPPQATLWAWALGREMENKLGKWLPGLPSCASYWGRDPPSLHLHLDFRGGASVTEGWERKGKEAGENFRALKKHDSTVCSGPLGSSQGDPLGLWEPQSQVLNPHSPFCCWSCVRSPGAAPAGGTMNLSESHASWRRGERFLGTQRCKALTKEVPAAPLRR